MTDREARALFLGGILLGTWGACHGDPTARSPAARRAAPETTPTRRSPSDPSPAEPHRPLPPHRRLADLSAVLRLVARADPLVIGVGEFHQKRDSAGVRSAIARFTRALPAALGSRAPGRRASDIVVETWITDGRCGKRERRAVARVERTTQRPKQTESEVVQLLRASKQSGLQPHILRLSCADYRKLGEGKLDHVELLALIGDHLRSRALASLAARRARRARRRRRAAQDPLVVLYGGALHNDVEPMRGLERFSYAAGILSAAAGRYIELDLYVPELVAGQELVRHEPWYPLVAEARADSVLLYRRSAISYAVILRRGLEAPEPGR